MKRLKPDFPSCSSCANRRMSVFNKLNQTELAELSDCKGCNQYNKGHLLFFEGSRPTGIFCINSGIVKIYKMTGEGRPQIIKLAGPGDIAGYEAILSDMQYKYFAEVIEETLVCYIPKNHFLQMLKDNFTLASTLMQQISLDLIYADKRTTSMATKPVRERVAESLLLLNEFYSAKSKGRDSSAITLSREEVAAYSGTATETAIRILSEFSREKLITLGKRCIAIVNQPKLSGIAHRYE